MTLEPARLRAGFRLGDRLVQPARNAIHGPEGEQHLEPKVMAVLLCLAEQAGDVVSRQSLYEAVWGNAVVSDQALTNCISELRLHLGDDRAHPRYIETVPKRGYRLVAPVHAPAGSQGSEARAAAAGGRLALTAAAAAALAVLLLLGWWTWRTIDARSSVSIAVLPFRNAAGVERYDYLRFALPDEIATLLTTSRQLAVRPFEHDPAGGNGPVRPRAEYVVTGHYYLDGDNRLTIAVEAQEAEAERLVWRAHASVPADDLLALRRHIVERVAGGLLPALGVPASGSSAPQPADPEAYREYLRSLALPRHPVPTLRAIDLLQRAVELDPDFAPAWTELGKRWYAHANYGDGGAEATERAVAAYRRALALDPAALSPAVELVNLRTESGELVQAHQEALRLVEDFDRSAEAHLALAYVYRFGGLLHASRRQCERALELDPLNPRLRSCAYSWLYSGQLEPVRAILELDEGSFYFHWGMVLLHLRRGDEAAALEAARQVAPEPTREFMEPCLLGARGQALDAPAAAFVAHWSRQREPELSYALAPMLEFCGRRDEALAFLHRAIERNFCAYPALDQDPAWRRLRDTEAFAVLREKALACHNRFRRSISGSIG